MGLEDLLKILEQASGSQTRSTASKSDPLTDLLGSLLGGGAPATPSRSSRSSGARRTSTVSNDPLSGILTPIVQELANKLGLPPELAQVVVSFALTQLMNSQANAGGATRGSNAGSVLAQGRGMLSNADSGLESAGLMQRLNSGQAIDSDFLQSSGLAQQLASQTGMDAQTAANSLQRVFTLLSETPSAPALTGSVFGKAGGVAAGDASEPSPSKSPVKKTTLRKSHKK